jgi:hypothetical protein
MALPVTYCGVETSHPQYVVVERATFRILGHAPRSSCFWYAHQVLTLSLMLTSVQIRVFNSSHPNLFMSFPYPCQSLRR